MENFFHLPIFTLTGGREESRTYFVSCLMTELTARSLTAVFLRRGDGSNLCTLALLARRYDLVIVNRGIDAPEQPITLGKFSGSDLGEISWSLGGEEGWPRFVERLLGKLTEYGRCTPVWGCVLIGGRSSRMGSPKHLIKDERGKTWLENVIETLRPLVDGIAVSGMGQLPEAVAETPRLPDIPGVVGPLTGIVAAGRWQPQVSWLLVACDMPHVSAEAVNWLLADRRPGCWGRVPRFAGNDRLEPLFAWYDFRSIHLFEEQLYTGNMRIGEAAGDIRIDHPIIPDSLCHSWKNINTPEELQVVER
jgi:molybdopterin-guanine dinucleotide biosynthesis protein A